MYEDIEHFFSTEKEETDQLEFKSYNSNGKLEDKLSGLIEGITAFLNSSGGVLIWGAPEGKKNPIQDRKERVFSGNLTSLPLAIEKDWLISKVSDKIIPLPAGIRVQLLRRDDYQVCVFEIDESRYSPHQTDGKYYMRIDGQKKPAPHHYIEALFKKISYPQLEAYIRPSSFNKIDKGYSLKIYFNFFNFSPFENEEYFNFRVLVSRGMFMRGAPVSRGYAVPGFSKRGTEFSPVDRLDILHYGQGHGVTEDIEFYNEDIDNPNGVASIMIFFGGKKSPMKMNKYEIKLINLSIENIMKPVTLFTVVFENMLMSEYYSSTGKSQLIEQEGYVR